MYTELMLRNWTVNVNRIDGFKYLFLNGKEEDKQGRKCLLSYILEEHNAVTSLQLLNVSNNLKCLSFVKP